METELERRREREQGEGGGMERVPLYWFPAEGGPTKGGLSIGSLVAAFPSLSLVLPFPLFRSFAGSAAIRPALARDGQRGTRRKSNDQTERRKRKETKERDGKRNNCAYSSWLRLPPSPSLSLCPSFSLLLLLTPSSLLSSMPPRPFVFLCPFHVVHACTECRRLCGGKHSRRNATWYTLERERGGPP